MTISFLKEVFLLALSENQPSEMRPVNWDDLVLPASPHGMELAL